MDVSCKVYELISWAFWMNPHLFLFFSPCTGGSICAAISIGKDKINFNDLVIEQKTEGNANG